MTIKIPQPDATNPAELVATFDPAALTAAFFRNPYPTYSALRERSPVHRCADGSWFLTRYSDLATIYRDRSHFSSDKRAVFSPKYGPGTPLFEHHTTSLVFNDPPYHTRIRRQIVAALSPAAVRAMTPGLEALVDRLCNGLADRGGGDLIADFAAAIPVEVIGNLLGVPQDERGALRDWSLAILGALDPALTPEALDRGHRSVVEFLDFTRRLVAARRRALRGEDDLLTRLIHDESGGERLTEQELLHNCIFLLNAGHETTTNLIGNGLALLLAHPTARDELIANPSLLSTAVEECLRLESPNQFGNRLVVVPVTVGDHTFPAGSYLTLCIGAANRDPREFPAADSLDVGRAPNRHLAFAAGGHACAGMSVARLEAEAAFAGFLRRFPTARLLPGARRSARARFRGYEFLPVTVAQCR